MALRACNIGFVRTRPEAHAYKSNVTRTQSHTLTITCRGMASKQNGGYNVSISVQKTPIFHLLVNSTYLKAIRSAF